MSEEMLDTLAQTELRLKIKSRVDWRIKQLVKIPHFMNEKEAGFIQDMDYKLSNNDNFIPSQKQTKWVLSIWTDMHSQNHVELPRDKI